MSNERLREALKALQAEHAILIATGDRVTIWSPNRDVDARMKRAVYRNKREVLKLLDLSEITTCPDPELHRDSWTWALSRYACDKCAMLKSYV